MPPPATLNFAAQWQGYAAVPRPRAADATSLQTLQGETMGTRWSLRLVNPHMRALAEVQALVQTQLDTVIAQMSHWEPDSLISQFNRAPAGEHITLPPEFAQVLSAGLHWAQASEGAFDPAAGQLVALWGFGPHAAAPSNLPPAPSAVADWLAQPNWRALHWPAVGPDAHEPNSPLHPTQAAQPSPLAHPTLPYLTQPGGLWLDFSGIAKGFAVDLVAQALLAAELPDFLIDIGGELRAHGQKPDGQPWRVQISHGTEADTPERTTPTVLNLRKRAVATSGSRWHHHEVVGQGWSHTVDPRTGQASASALHAVTVVHAQCLHADALATTLWVLGPQAGLAFANAHGVAACLHTRQGETLTSTHWTQEPQHP